MFYSDILMSPYCLSGCKKPSLLKESYNYMASLTANIRAIYFAPVDDSAIVNCFFEYQLTSSLLSINIKLDIDF